MRPSVLTSPTPRMTRRRRTAVLLCSANHDVDSTGRNGTASAVAMSRIARRKRRLKLRVTRRTFRPCEADSSGAHSRVERPSVREPRESSGLRRSTGAPPYQRLPALPRSYRPAVLRDVEDAAIVTNAAADGFGLEVRVIEARSAPFRLTVYAPRSFPRPRGLCFQHTPTRRGSLTAPPFTTAAWIRILDGQAGGRAEPLRRWTARTGKTSWGPAPTAGRSSGGSCSATTRRSTSCALRVAHVGSTAWRGSPGRSACRPGMRGGRQFGRRGEPRSPVVVTVVRIGGRGHPELGAYLGDR